jgi:hypothetical protein
MSNQSVDLMGHYVAIVQKAVNDLAQSLNQSFSQSGELLSRGDIQMNGYSINNAESISVGTLRYDALDPPISSGGNISGPLSSIDNALLRYNGTSGQAVRNSSVTLSDDAKFEAVGGSIDMGTTGVINFVATSVNKNGSAIVASSASSVTDSHIPIWDSTSGSLLKNSGVPISAIAAKLPLAGGIMVGAINMGTNNITNVGSISGSVKTSAADDIVTSTASGVSDMEIAVFNSSTGKIVKASGVLVSVIATKLSTGGGTMSGSINMGGFGISNADFIAGTVKSSQVNDIVTSESGVVIDSYLPVWSGTTGRVLKNSSIAVTSVAIGAASSTDNAVARYDGTSGKTLQNSTVTISDDSKIAANGCTIDMSIGGVLNFVTGGSVQVNGSDIITVTTIAPYVRGPTSAVNNRLAAYDLATGKLIKDSGILSSDVVLASSTVTDNAVARYDTTSGRLLQNSAVTISDDAKIAAVGGTIDMSSAGIIDFQATSVRANGATFLTDVVLDEYAKGPASAVDSNVAAFDTATGKLLKDSGIATSSIVSATGSSTDNAVARFDSTSGRWLQTSSVTISDDAKIAAVGGSINIGTAGVLDLVATSVRINGSAAARVSDLASFVEGPVSAVNDNIPAFDTTSGKLLKDSGVAIGSIAAKMPLAGGTFAGHVYFDGNNVIDIGLIVGTTKSSAPDDLVTSSSGTVVDSEIPIWDGTTGRLIKTSGMALTALAIGAASSTDNAVARYDGITGRLLQNSAVTISDDAKIAATGGTIDMSISGNIDLVATNVYINGNPVATSVTLAAYVQGPASAVVDNIATYNAITGKVVKDSGVAIGQIANKLPLAGGTMSGTINMSTNNITNVGSISGSTNSRTADNIVSNSGTGGSGYLASFVSDKVIQDSGIVAANVVTNSSTGTVGNVPTFSADKVIQDSGTALSALATSASVSSTYLAKAGGAMTGALDISATQITVGNSGNFNVNTQASGTSCVLIGFFGSSASGANDIVIGAQNSATQQYAVCIGNGITSTGVRQVNLGGGNFGITNPQPNSVAIGIDQTLGTGSNGICIGNAAQIGAVNDAISIGSGAVNSTANSCLIGDAAIANIRPNSTNTCDLGTTSNKFKSLHLGSNANVAGDANVTGTLTAGNASVTGTLGAGATTLSGTLDMGANNITGSGSVSAGSFSASGTTDASSTSTGTLVTAGGLGVAKKAYIGTDLSVGGSCYVGAAGSGVAKLEVIGGVTNVASEETAIRCTTSTTSITAVKIELRNTNASGKNYELRSLSNGSFDLTDRTGSGTRLTIASSGATSISGILTASNSTDSSSITTGGLIASGGLGVTKKVYIGDNTIIGTNQTRTFDSKLVLQGTNASTAGPHITAYTASDQYPVFQNLNWSHDTVALNFDCYYDGSWRSSSSGTNYQIYKINNQLQFNYSAGVAAGTTINSGSGPATAGYVDSTGILQWQKPMTIKGQYMGGTKYVQRAGGTTFASSTAETSWFTGVGTSTGSLVYAIGSMTLGFCLKFTGHAIMTMTGGGTVTFRFRSSVASQIITSISFTPSAFTSQIVKVVAWMTWVSGVNTFSVIEVYIPGQSPQIAGTTGSSWTSASAHTIDMTVQFGTSSPSNSFQSYRGILESVNDQ